MGIMWEGKMKKMKGIKRLYYVIEFLFAGYFAQERTQIRGVFSLLEEQYLHIGMKKLTIITGFVLSFTLILMVDVNAQSKKEAKGDRLMEQYAFQSASEMLKKALEEEGGENDAIKKKLAECFRRLNDPENTARYYRDIMDNTNLIEAEDKYYYAQALCSMGDYPQAKEWFSFYSEEVPEDARSKKYSALLDNLDQLYKDSSRFQLNRVNFNSETADFSPAFYKDGIVFVSGRSKRLTKFKWNETEFLDLYISSTDSRGNYNQPEVFYKKMNTSYHEGPLAFYNNEHNLVLTRTNFEKGIVGQSSNGVSKLKMYFSALDQDGKWTKSEPFQYNSDEYSVGHPAITEDGMTMYFISDMSGGFGGTDIYVTINNGQTWSEPHNLGPEINTEGNEMFPFLHNNERLYFASNGHGGLGGLDILNYEFECKEVNNVGYPLNSAKDDFSLILNEEGNQGFLASNRKSQSGADNIYSFDFFPETLLTVKCVVIDAVLHTPIANSQVVINGNDEEVATYSTNGNGVVHVPLKLARQYHVGASKADYIDNSIDVTANAGGEAIIIELTKDFLPDKGLVQISESQDHIDGI